MRAHGQAKYAAGQSGHPGAARCEVRVWTARTGIVVMALVLSACASQLPAPVESRGDEPAALQSTVQAPASGDAAPVAAVPEVSPEATEATETTREAPLPEPEVGSAAAVASDFAPRRLAALNPAIIDLLNAANRHSAAGRYDGAVAAVERALQIELADAGLWHRLARIRFDQGKPDLAEALAAKSNSLAAGDENLQAQNWRLIAKARRLLGDASGANDALAHASRLQD